MNHTIKLIIPIGLGIAAAVVNSMVLSAQTKPVKFVRAASDIPRGQVFTQDNLEVLEFPGIDARGLSKSAIPWSEVGILLGQRAVRDLVAGDVVFFQDFGVRGAELNIRPGEVANQISIRELNLSDSTLIVGAQVMFRLRPNEGDEAEWFGPCRLIAVGNRLTNAVLNSGVSSSGGSVNTVWVATPAEPSTTAEKRLAKALDDFAVQQVDGNARVLGLRIVDDHRAAGGS